MTNEYDYFESIDYHFDFNENEMNFSGCTEENWNGGKGVTKIDMSNNIKDSPKHNENILTKNTSKKTDVKSDSTNLIGFGKNKKQIVKFKTKKFSNKKRGRKKNNNSGKIHTKNALDNVQIKIQRYYINHLIDKANVITNIVLNKNLNTKHFRKINDKEKSKIFSSNKMEKLKYKDIFKLKISSKNKGIKGIYKEGMTNLDIYENICQESPILKDYFEQSYLDIFKNNYYANRDEFDFNGKNYILSNQTYNYLLYKNKGTEQEVFEYIIKRDYIPKEM